MPSSLRKLLIAGTLGVLAVALVGVQTSPAPALTTLTASNETELQAAFATDDTVEVTLLSDITLTCAVDDLDRSSQFPLTVIGDGHTITQTCAGYGIVENTDFRADLEFQRTTLTGGDKQDSIVHQIQPGGGAIASSAPVTMIDSSIVGNTSATFPGGGQGGAIFISSSGSTLTVTNSLIQGNTAESNGGAISTAGDVIINGSTVSGNTANTVAFAFDGGAIYTVDITPVTITNSTITNNVVTTGVAGAAGGAVQAVGPVTLVYATVVDNTAPAGANLAVDELVSFGSVVALPNGSVNCSDAAGTGLPTTTSNGWNYSDDSSCGFTGTGDTENGGDPLLGTLGDNGGPTPTRLPQAASPLLDAIPTASCGGPAGDITTDQRGMTRPQGSACDIGAVEVEVAEPEPAPIIQLVPTFTG